MSFTPRLLLFALALIVRPLHAQDLSPRAYVITPVQLNVVTITWSYFNGGVNLNGAIPITGATGIFYVSSFTYYRSLSFFGRSANVAVSLPYGVGNFRGRLEEQQRSVYRSGLLDFGARISVNLLGGEAMPADKFAKWKQKMLLGASLKIIAPTGQYDGTKIVNWGINRWAFKPELGYSQRWGHWLVDAYAGAWFYTTNSAFFAVPVPQPQNEEPIGSLEGHISHDLQPGSWVSLDGNFWWGGVTSLNGIKDLATKQTGSRIGVTVAWRFSKHQS
jgi:hypothetical protein